ncbi:hypothetical protein [Uliginosibacterium sediminicola]|uniref:Uncharacterized protein n=1 Tax=Uliginosibacterium sediminicola TaxID=2024550 RepID=A0ABU9YVZ9_9RHOO
MLDQHHQDQAVSRIDHYAHMAKECISQAASEYMRPSVIYKPKLSIDGNKWCALYGNNLQEGVAGFGDSPMLAMCDFDDNWHKRLPPASSAAAACTGANGGQADIATTSREALIPCPVCGTEAIHKMDILERIQILPKQAKQPNDGEKR